MESPSETGFLARNDEPANELAAGVIAHSEAMRSLYRKITRVAATELAVIIQGESGTGKEAVARAIHDRSPRRKGPFVEVNCSELPSSLAASQLFGHERGAFTGADHSAEGLFGAADGGTLFLDEVAELALDQQAMLLRALDHGLIRRVGAATSRRVSVRVVCASHVDLLQAVREGRLRNDLYQRLRGARLELPPLRDRREDLAPLVKHFLGPHRGPGPGPALLPEAWAALQRHPFPGNVRELKAAVERALAMAEHPQAITAADLDLDPIDDSTGPDRHAQHPDWLYLRGKSLKAAMVATKEKAIQRHEGNKQVAARELRVSRSAMYRMD